MPRPKSVLFEEKGMKEARFEKEAGLKPSSQAFVKIKQVTAKQRKYAELRAEGMPVSAAARAAGFKSNGTSHGRLEQDNRIQALIEKTKIQTAEDLKMTRRQVLSGFLEAIDIGRVQADPHAMVKGWTEIGKMCGYYAPEVKNVNLSISAKRMIDKFETMTDEELLRLAEKTIDGTFTEVPGQENEGQARQAGDPPLRLGNMP